MKILIASSLKRRLGPEVTASRLSIIFQISEGMVKKGHDVAILGTADSNVPGAQIIPIIPKSFTDLPKFENPVYAEASYNVQMLKKLEEVSGEFDIIHNHAYPEFLNLIADVKAPMVTTIHAQATPELDNALALFPNSNLISISKAHHSQFKKAKFLNYTYNGIDTDLFSYNEEKEGYLLWIGRLSKAKNDDGSFMDPKGVKWAIKLAEETGSRLKLTGNVEDPEFFEKDVKPHLNDRIEWIGPISSEQKMTKQEIASLMQKAKAFLMTINWYEPFGLVMAEAMSCGTPVIGFNRGSVSELIKDGETGFVVEPEGGIEGLKDALSKIDTIENENCRKRVEENFSLERMIDNYESVYKEIIK